MSIDTLHDVIGREGAAILWWQMSIRAIVIFGIGLVFLRLTGKRVFGKWGAFDILLAVIIGSNLSRAITASAPFLPTLAASAALILFHASLAYLAIRFPTVASWFKGEPTALVQHGEIDWNAMRRHAVGKNDLDQALRSAGQLNTAHVRAAYLERNGEISVILAAQPDVPPT